jgi:[ribosomal protein S5]-alanine N-acetyltransferase
MPHLRRWSPSDAADLADALHADPDLGRQLGGDADDLAEYIAAHLTPADSRAPFALVLDGRVVGNVAVTAIDPRHDTGWASYWLAPVARGRGLASAGLTAVAAWAFTAGLFRLELGHRVNNPASCRVATAAGFAVEGLARAKLRYGDERFDVETHARLATDPEPVTEPLPIR